MCGVFIHHASLVGEFKTFVDTMNERMLTRLF
ncbi:Uncharacterised protein [Vibrio cholerae]|nr:Uncharacterised protein [Vibrio cholerae]